jgi:hypothetical protein
LFIVGTFEENILQAISIIIEGQLLYPTPPKKILEHLGEPSEIYISLHRYYGAALVLEYPELQTNVVYYTTDWDMEENLFCLDVTQWKIARVTIYIVDDEASELANHHLEALLPATTFYTVEEAAQISSEALGKQLVSTPNVCLSYDPSIVSEEVP